MEAKRISPLKAIRLKCLDCCCGSSNEVKLCTLERCPLYPFREGHNPYIAKREYTDEERAAVGARLAKSRLSGKGEKNANPISEGYDIPPDVILKNRPHNRPKTPQTTTGGQP